MSNLRRRAVSQQSHQRRVALPPAPNLEHKARPFAATNLKNVRRASRSPFVAEYNNVFSVEVQLFRRTQVAHSCVALGFRVDDDDVFAGHLKLDGGAQTEPCKVRRALLFRPVQVHDDLNTFVSRARR